MNESYDLYNRGREKMEMGHLDEAIALLERSAALSPHHKTLELLGECFLMQKRWTDAVIPLAAATALNEQSRAPALLATVFLEQGERHDAMRFAQLALARSPGNRQAEKVLQSLASEESSRQ